MPIVHMPIDDSTLIATSTVMSVLTFGFCASIGIKPRISLMIGAVVGIILYSVEIIPIGLLAVVGFSIVAVISKNIFFSNAQQDNLTSHLANQDISVVSDKSKYIAHDKPKEVEQIASPEIVDSEEFKNFLIVDSIRQLTDLAQSQGLIVSQELARNYWESFNSRIQFFHFKRILDLTNIGFVSGIKLASIDEVKSAIEKELEPVFKRATQFMSEGMSEELALAKSIVEWYKSNNLLVQNVLSTHSKHGKQLTEKEIDAFISNTARALNFNMGWLANVTALNAERGNENSQCQLANMYCNGQNGFPQDYTEAEKWFRLAANKGNADAKAALRRISREIKDRQVGALNK